MARFNMPHMSRRSLLQSASAVPLVAALARSALAQSGEAINFTAWSAAVDQAKSHVTGFEKATGSRSTTRTSRPRSFAPRWSPSSPRTSRSTSSG